MKLGRELVGSWHEIYRIHRYLMDGRSLPDAKRELRPISPLVSPVMHRIHNPSDRSSRSVVRLRVKATLAQATGTNVWCRYAPPWPKTGPDLERTGSCHARCTSRNGNIGYSWYLWWYGAGRPPTKSKHSSGGEGKGKKEDEAIRSTE